MNYLVPQKQRAMFLLRAIEKVEATANAKAFYFLICANERTKEEVRLSLSEYYANRSGIARISVQELRNAETPVVISCGYEVRIGGKTGYTDKAGKEVIHKESSLAINDVAIVGRIMTLEDEIRIKSGRFAHVTETEVAEMTD